MPKEKLLCTAPNAPRFWDWICNRGGLAVWHSVNLSNPGASWTTPATAPDGTPTEKPTWQADNKPARIITDPDEVEVVISKEVKRFHVAVRMGTTLNLVVSDGGTRRIRKEVEKAGPGAWYEFDYLDYDNAVIYVSGEKMTLTEWAAREEKREAGRA